MKFTAKSLFSAVLALILCLNMLPGFAMAAEPPDEGKISAEVNPSATEETDLAPSDPLYNGDSIVVPPDSTAENPSIEHSEDNTVPQTNNPPELPPIDTADPPMDSPEPEMLPPAESLEALMMPEVMLMSAGPWDNNPMTSAQVAALGIPYYEIDGVHVGLGMEPHPQPSSGCGYTGTSSVLNLPSSIDGKQVTEIGDYAFYDPNGIVQYQFTQVNFPNGLKKIGDRAFLSSKLTSVYLPDGIEEIGYDCFASSYELAKVRIPGSITACAKNIGNAGPFGYCKKLTSAGPLGSGCDIEFGWIEEIPRSAFQGVINLTSVIFPEGLRKIGGQAFEFCNLTSVTFPETLEAIGYSAFRYNKNLSGNLVFPKSFTTIGGSSFEECAITSARFKGVVKKDWNVMPFFHCNQMEAVYLDSCLASRDGWGQHRNGGHPIPIPVIWSHKLTSDWSPWAKTSDAHDENGKSLWNGNYRHYRTATCAECGLAYEFEKCNFIYSDTWSPNGSDDHIKKGVCTVCGETDYEFEAHTGLGPWVQKDKHVHARSVNCDICGYVGEQTEQHHYEYGSWTDYDEQSHVRTGTCSTCGYEYQQFYAHYDYDNDGQCDACGHEMTRFSVTVPASLNLYVSETGAVYAADTASIINRSTADVAVTSMEYRTANGWTIVPYGTDMANEPVDAKEIGFQINTAESVASGRSEKFNLNGSGWNIQKNSSLPLEYDAAVSATSVPLQEQVLTITFILDWAK